MPAKIYAIKVLVRNLSVFICLGAILTGGHISGSHISGGHLSRGHLSGGNFPGGKLAWGQFLVTSMITCKNLEKNIDLSDFGVMHRYLIITSLVLCYLVENLYQYFALFDVKYKPIPFPAFLILQRNGELRHFKNQSDAYLTKFCKT